MSFARTVRKFAETADRRADFVRRELAARLAERMIDETPKESGRAAANWVVSVNVPKREANWKADNPAIARIAARAAAFQPGEIDVIYVQNPLSYAPRLEYGWSPQGQGFFRRGLVEAPGMIRDIAREAQWRIR